MEIRGREIKWMCTVEAHHKIAGLAPDNSIQTVMDQLRSADHIELYSTVVLFLVAMSEGYENYRAWEDPDYKPNPLTLDELNHMRRGDVDTLLQEAFDIFLQDIGVTVETEPIKGKKDEGGASD